MFSVPGWNLSAPLATQVEKAKPNDDGREGKKSKKRKRKQQEQDVENHVGEQWAQGSVGAKTKSHGTSANAVKVRERPTNGDLEKQVKHTDGDMEKNGKKRKTEGNNQHSNGDIEQKDISAGAETPALEHTSKRDKKKRKKQDKLDDKPNPTSSKAELLQAPPNPSTSTPLIPEPKGLTPLQRSMRAKLTSARFRHLNESLYTKPSTESLSLFTESPEMFEDYHRGFAQQVEVWPENPVDSYVEAILTRGKIRAKDNNRKDHRGNKNAPSNDAKSATPSLNGKSLPRNPRNNHATIADLGCGTASLSHRLQPHLKRLNLTLHSFDLSKPIGPTGPLVTVADISALPLPDGSVDVAIFCLALMGTNWLDFIDESWRILRWRGELWVSEIKSRFGRVSNKRSVPINSVGSLHKSSKPNKKAKAKKGEEAVKEGIQGSEDEAELAERVDGAESKEGTDVSAFVEVLKKRGFVLDALPERQSDAIDLSNKMFVKMQFVKGTQPTRGKNVKKEDSGGGRGSLKMGMKGKKFAVMGDDAEDGGGDEVDLKVLKPCLYKIR